MKATSNSDGGTYEGEIGLRDSAKDMEKISDTETAKNEAVTPGTIKKKSRRRFECQKGTEPHPRQAMEFVHTVYEGVHIDVKQGRRKGETTPPEFWARVWDDIHRSGGGPPDNLPNKTLRNKWKDMEGSGNSREQIWENMEREYPVPFLVVPLIHRWHHLGKGKPVETAKMFDGLDMYNGIMLMIKDNAELKEKLDKMKQEGKEEEFWNAHWDDVHSMESMRKMCEDKKSVSKRSEQDWEAWLFPRRRTDRPAGQEVKMIPVYQERYPLGYSWYCRLRKPADERPIYKEFDFCS